MSSRVLVLGSSNIDLILRVPRFHNPGETIRAENLLTVFGGKGANQAVASKRLGGRVAFITKLGGDPYGKNYREYLIESGLDPKGLLEDRGNPTGVALIELNPKGENRIIVSPGANGALSTRDLKRLGALWKESKVFLAQLEIPLTTVKLGLEMARRQGALTLLNPSPPVRLSPEILSQVDYIVPNEWEARFLTGMKLSGRKDIRKIARKLQEMGPKNVVITLGPQGLFFKGREEEIWMGAFKVNVLDTTAAGDALMGALACGLFEEKPIPEVLRFASGAGALAATKVGAQPSLPARKDLDRFLAGAVLPGD